MARSTLNEKGLYIYCFGSHNKLWFGRREKNSSRKTNPTEESANDGVLENIYYSIPSPIETTILIREGGLEFSGDLLFPEDELMPFSDKTSTALVLEF